MKKDISPKIISLIFSILVICFAVGFYVYAAWTEPTAAPPGGNVFAPINVGGDLQYKSGSLGVGGLSVDFNTYLATDGGNVGIGTTEPGAKLDVAGTVNVQALTITGRNNAPDSPGWRTISPTYRYDAGQTPATLYVWNKIAKAAQGSHCGMTIRVESKSDQNYPQFSSYVVSVGRYSNGTSNSLGIARIAGDRGAQACIDITTGDVWLRDYAVWGSRAIYKVEVIVNDKTANCYALPYDQHATTTWPDVNPTPYCVDMDEGARWDGAGTKTHSYNYKGAGLWSQSGSDIYYNTGNVGIGDTTPNAKLDVEGDARFDYSGGYTTIKDSSGVQVYNAEGTTGQVRLGAAWGKPGVYSSGSLYLFSDTGGVYIGDSNSEKMFIRADGNVGIGTTSPGAKLDVVGDVGGVSIQATGDICTDQGGGVCLSTGAGGGGDITAVNAGTGLTGGGTSGDVTLNADTSYMQRRITGTCGSNQAIRIINSNGTVSCVSLPPSAICTWEGTTYSTGARCCTRGFVSSTTWSCGANGAWNDIGGCAAASYPSCGG